MARPACAPGHPGRGCLGFRFTPPGCPESPEANDWLHSRSSLCFLFAMTPKTNAPHSKHSRHGAPAAKPAKTEKSATSEKNSAARLLGTLGVRLEQELEDAKKGWKRTGASPKERARLEAEKRVAEQIARQQARACSAEEEGSALSASQKRQLRARRKREVEASLAMARSRDQERGPKNGRLSAEEELSRLRASMWRSAKRGDKAKLRAQMDSPLGRVACRWVDENGRTILMHAVSRGKDCLSVLEGVVDIDAQCRDGHTALHLAVSEWGQGRPNRAAWWSLAQKSNWSIKDRAGQTALAKMVRIPADKDILRWIEFIEKAVFGASPSARQAKGAAGGPIPEKKADSPLADKFHMVMSEAFDACWPENYQSITKLAQWASVEQLTALIKKVDGIRRNKSGGGRAAADNLGRLAAFLERVEMMDVLRAEAAKEPGGANRKAPAPEEEPAQTTAPSKKSDRFVRRRI